MFLLTRKDKTRRPRGSAERGFSVVELILAMAIMLLLLGVVFVLFDRMYDLGETAAAIGDVNQNVRASINLIARDLTMVGTGVPIGGVPIPNGNGSQQIRRPGWGLNYFPFPPPNGVMPAITPGQSLGPTVINQTSDEITLIAVPPGAIFVQVPVKNDALGNAIINSTGTQVTLNSAPAGIAVDNIILLTNTVGTALGMVTAIDTTNNTINFDSTDPIKLNQPTAAFGKIANLQSGTPPAYPPTVLTQVRMITYYLDNTDPNQSKLMRQVDAPDPPGNPNPPSPVAMNVVALRFSYDLSDGVTINRGDANGQPNQIRKVNIQVTGRSSQPLRRTRQYFVNTMTTSVTIRNLEYQSRY